MSRPVSGYSMLPLGLVLLILTIPAGIAAWTGPSTNEEARMTEATDETSYSDSLEIVIASLNDAVRGGFLPQTPSEHEFFREFGSTWDEVYAAMADPNAIPGGLTAVLDEAFFKPFGTTWEEFQEAVASDSFPKEPIALRPPAPE